MLSIMRRHAGWGLKVILGVVIVSFVFFFGYTAIRQEAPDSAALEVGEETISYSQYRFFHDNQRDLFREKFKEGEMPPFAEESIRLSAQRQVVQRSLTRQFAGSLGFRITDEELARYITRDQNFDPVAYRNFIQYFYRQNGFAYEDLVREDLLIQKFQEWAQKTDSPLVDAWYQQFAGKADVRSFIQDANP
ncbi:MAG: SurA N-terminal domain-containing protein [Deltaproteobacteria bacterium]|nr:SurA N-terminal domain-containing protein [Deltaproteobacteria bacterium]